MSECWTPNDHTYTGECLAQRVEPHYATMPDRIRIFDRAARTQGWNRENKRLWRRAVSQAAMRWGYPSEIIELGRRDRYDYKRQGITLDRYVHTPPYGPQGGYGGFGLAPIERPEMSEFDQDTWDDGKGFALVHDNGVAGMFASRAIGIVAGILTHEIGHALGFGHGGFGVMRSVGGPPYHPDAFELAALERYWGRA